MEEAPRDTVLVVGNDEDRGLWKELFQAHGLSCVVGEWPDLHLTSYPSADPTKRLQVSIQKEGTCFVSFVVIRKLCRGLDAVSEDFRNKVTNVTLSLYD